MQPWLQTIGQILGGLGAGVAAFVAVYAIRRQEAASSRALTAQAEATAQALEHQRRLSHDERLWTRRVDLYARITLAMREHLDRPLDDAGSPIPLGEVQLMAGLASEAEILASPAARDLINDFVYNDPGSEEKINIWNDFSTLARRELVREAG